MDSQSVKTTDVGGLRGYDGAKKLVGRKRHILVDTEGLVYAVNVHPANSMDRDGIKLVLDEATRAQLPRMRLLWLDAGYNGRGKGKDWVEKTTSWQVVTVKAIHRFKRYWVPNDIPPDQIDWSKYLPEPGFHVIPRRWVVERTFAWFAHNRRLSKPCMTSLREQRSNTDGGALDDDGFMAEANARPYRVAWRPAPYSVLRDAADVVRGHTRLAQEGVGFPSLEPPRPDRA